ncbi:MAG: zinc-dependent peptidase [Chitinophagaceae bacterium]|nr:zinc-dependent peptidase [Chitinophagaceae bacterium]
MFIFSIVCIVGIAFLTGRIIRSMQESPIPVPEEGSKKGALVYPGNELSFTGTILTEVLVKRFTYFTALSSEEQERFLSRLKKFIASKTFIIHDSSGFREMPILISASAVQLSFGLKEYLLPFFRFIHIFPAEFVGVQPSIRVLAGNVSGNRIHVSWKHFLEGFQYPHDGENVGLHEMAHAYYFQNFETGANGDPTFVSHFPSFNNCGNKIFEQEKLPGNDFFSEYALTSFQEFWAESIERFFEKPAALKAAYPQLYSTMAALLNQDPLDHPGHLFQQQ